MTGPFEHERWEELAVAHALDALEPSEDASFIEHLDRCARCRAVVEDVAASAADLALTVDSVEPPASLRDALFSAVGETPQVTQPAARPVAKATGLRPVVPMLRPAARAAREWRAPSAGRWLVGAAAGLALVLGLGVVATVDLGSGSPDSVGVAFGRCLDDTGCTPIRLLNSDGTVMAAVLVRGTHAELVSERLARNPVGSTTYVLWARHTAGTVKAVGGFDIVGGKASVHSLDSLPWRIGDISAFMVTREAGNVAPATGSAAIAQGVVEA